MIPVTSCVPSAATRITNVPVQFQSSDLVCHGNAPWHPQVIHQQQQSPSYRLIQQQHSHPSLAYPAPHSGNQVQMLPPDNYIHGFPAGVVINQNQPQLHQQQYIAMRCGDRIIHQPVMTAAPFPMEHHQPQQPTYAQQQPPIVAPRGYYFTTENVAPVLQPQQHLPPSMNMSAGGQIQQLPPTTTDPGLGPSDVLPSSIQLVIKAPAVEASQKTDVKMCPVMTHRTAMHGPVQQGGAYHMSPLPDLKHESPVGLGSVSLADFNSGIITGQQQGFAGLVQVPSTSYANNSILNSASSSNMTTRMTGGPHFTVDELMELTKEVDPATMAEFIQRKQNLFSQLPDATSETGTKPDLSGDVDINADAYVPPILSSDEESDAGDVSFDDLDQEADNGSNNNMAIESPPSFINQSFSSFIPPGVSPLVHSNMLECVECLQQIPERKMKDHLKDHTRLPPFICRRQECRREFPSFAGLSRHIRVTKHHQSSGGQSRLNKDIDEMLRGEILDLCKVKDNNVDLKVQMLKKRNETACRLLAATVNRSSSNDEIPKTDGVKREESFESSNIFQSLKPSKRAKNEPIEIIEIVDSD